MQSTALATWLRRREKARDNLGDGLHSSATNRFRTEVAVKLYKVENQGKRPGECVRNVVFAVIQVKGEFAGENGRAARENLREKSAQMLCSELVRKAGPCRGRMW